MSHGFYMNIDKLALEIVEENIEKMTNNNLCELDVRESFVERVFFENNLKYGYISIIMLASYIENSINNILANNVGYNGERLLKLNLEDKLDLLYLKYDLDIAKLKKQHYFGAFKDVTKLRNELIHYKQNFIGKSTMINSKYKGHHIIYKLKLAEKFTKENITKLKEDVKKFIEIIANNLGLKINYQCKVITCDGEGENYAFIEKSYN